MANEELTRTADVLDVPKGTSVQVCTLGNDQPVSGTLEDISWGTDEGEPNVLLIDAGNWLWRVPVPSITAWATYGRTPSERF